ncbi:DUF2797 domain-containing protein [Motiliproteus sp. MSK22-1]|uniref:DUF2797 domain-containing protein n=1 Tax=Motiliproteus sp. MSK22-1 TaxID=1897630 RepID=UPI000978A791|nr:DUF2797 domain-containing protein [Motiliproteus sp. MSK22-1]OMH25300.1 hypothetical protein BGP75_26230 [Motiliproteus sp. MSK22-1]
MSLQIQGAGALRKLRIQLDSPAVYKMPVGDHEIDLNGLLGKPIRLNFLGAINCIHCGRKTNKSFNQGYCFPCFKSLPECDSCIMSPEKCHFHLDTCRDPLWGEQQCMQGHVVYLANSSGLKVGITRASQVPTRWLDQGAVQALPILRVATRYQSGLIETAFKEHVNDRTNWRAMLKNNVEMLNMEAERDRLFELLDEPLRGLEHRFGVTAIQRLHQAEEVALKYPVIDYPKKITSLSFDKTPIVEGTLQGLKGQYLMLDSGVINIRKFAAYDIELLA